jgi:hypothetical protein
MRVSPNDVVSLFPKGLRMGKVPAEFSGLSGIRPFLKFQDWKLLVTMNLRGPAVLKWSPRPAICVSPQEKLGRIKPALMKCLMAGYDFAHAVRACPAAQFPPRRTR